MPIPTNTNLIYGESEMKGNEKSELSPEQKAYLKKFDLDEKSAAKYYQDANTFVGNESLESMRLSKKEVDALIEKKGIQPVPEQKMDTAQLTDKQKEYALKFGLDPNDVARTYNQNLPQREIDEEGKFHESGSANTTKEDRIAKDKERERTAVWNPKIKKRVSFDGYVYNNIKSEWEIPTAEEQFHIQNG